MAAKSENLNIKVSPGSPLTPHDEALYETGKKMLSDSLDLYREFSKFMVGVSMSGIPIFIGLIQYLNIDDLSITHIIPVILFLSSAILFIFGYFPRHGKFSLEIIDEIDEAIKKVMKARKPCIYAGLGLFFLGVILAILISMQLLYEG